ncbi:hypothetical protein BJX68DRAFT_243617 [Aspergillus pseudodeflectus]|uniref:Uncharacterized protein n=1 Tax=Aspergillus pseudodeflectus TaxID=176178 RepID=A0ABR4JUQ6_9EURO
MVESLPLEITLIVYSLWNLAPLCFFLCQRIVTYLALLELFSRPRQPLVAASPESRF